MSRTSSWPAFSLLVLMSKHDWDIAWTREYALSEVLYVWEVDHLFWRHQCGITKPL
jgi:hypothetical protein